MSEKSIKFETVKKIIVAPFAAASIYVKQGFLVISSTGEIFGKFAGLEGVTTIEGVKSTYGMFFHATKIKDYVAAYVLYKNELDKIGHENLVEALDETCKSGGTDTIVFLGYGYKGQFCYRYILANYLNGYGAEFEDYLGDYDENLRTQQKLWTTDLYQSRGHFNLDDTFVGIQLESMTWTFAKTMPNNPHYWALRKNFGDDEMFLGIVKHIRNFGKFEEFGGQMYRVFTYGDHSYWTMAVDLLDEDCDLINRRNNKTKK